MGGNLADLACVGSLEDVGITQTHHGARHAALDAGHWEEYMRNETARWTKVIKEAGLKPER